MYKAQTLLGARCLQLVEKELPSPQSGEVVLKLVYAGICGSDLEYYKHGRCAHFVPRAPLVLGHEFVGVVHSLGSAVRRLKLGDMVAVDPAMPCGACPYCKDGRYNLCDDMVFFGSASCFPHKDGGFAQYAVVPAHNCFVASAAVPVAELALLEPFCVAFAAVKKIERLATSHVLLFGGGAIGQLVIKALRHCGARSVTLVDTRKAVEKLALENGAHAVYTPSALQRGSFDVCIDATGAPAAIYQCYEKVAKGGQLVQIGTTPEDALLPINAIMSKELTVRGSFRFAHVFETALELLERKAVSLANVVSHTVSLEHLEDGFALLLNEHEYTCKVQVACAEGA